jgi:NADH-quinone oxidoreductase subunit M
MVPLLTLFPLACALILLGIKKENVAWIQRVATLGALVPSALSIFLFASYDPVRAGIQFETAIPWIPKLGISYHVGIDGISAARVLLHGL